MAINVVDPAEPLHGNYTTSFNSVLKDFPTDIRDISDSQWKTSKCRIHDSVVHSLSSGTGCQRKKPGTLPPISALYAARPNAYCHCDEGTRMRDASMARMMLNCAAEDGEIHVGVGVERFQDARSVSHDVVEFGAGFCYMEGIVATQRVRVAHVLGGKEPLVADALRAVVVAGRTAMRAVKVEEVRPGFYHVSHDKAVKGMLPDGGMRFAARLYEIAVATGGTARVGSSSVAEMSAEKVAAWAAERGVVIPNEAMRDLSLSTCALGAVPATFIGGRSRSRLLSLVGDRFLKLVLSAHVVDDGGEIGAVQDREAATQSNEVLKDCLLSSGLVKYITVPAGAMLSAKVGGSILEAMVGVVFHHAGYESALRFALAVGVKGLD